MRFRSGHDRWVGGVAQARGDLTAAEQAFAQAFAQYLAISERLGALDPANTDWQRNLALAHGRVGKVARSDTQGPLDEEP
jgi:hypothetical protein